MVAAGDLLADSWYTASRPALQISVADEELSQLQSMEETTELPTKKVAALHTAGGDQPRI